MITSKAWEAISWKSWLCGVWVTAMTRSAPSLRACFAAAIPVGTEGRNFRSPGLETTGVSSSEIGISAIFSPAIFFHITRLSSGGCDPSGPVMVIEAQGYFDAFTFSKKFFGPKSNSWLPGTAMSNGTILVRSIVFCPLSSPESSEGESMSPSKT
jgi:hypothetical protein